MDRCRSIFALIAAALAASSCGSTAFAADEAVWALLKKPGHIVLLRHSNAPGQMQESNDMDFKNCAIQRNLDADGRAQAGRIGVEFRKHGIKQVKLVSSIYCRALDTAKLMKLGPVTPQPMLNQVFLADIPGMREAGTKGRALLKAVPAKQLTVLVSHVSNIQAMAGVQLDSGQMAVVHLDPAGEVVVDGKITVP
jgi:phosphohistidine phosphatase SixA